MKPEQRVQISRKRYSIISMYCLLSFGILSIVLGFIPWIKGKELIIIPIGLIWVKTITYCESEIHKKNNKK